MREFQDMVQCCGLEDLSFVGPTFTLSNSQEDNPISKKLDRVIVNNQWLTFFPLTSATFEMGGVSDHTRF